MHLQARHVEGPAERLNGTPLCVCLHPPILGISISYKTIYNAMLQNPTLTKYIFMLQLNTTPLFQLSHIMLVVNIQQSFLGKYKQTTLSRLY